MESLSYIIAFIASFSALSLLLFAISALIVVVVSLVSSIYALFLARRLTFQLKITQQNAKSTSDKLEKLISELSDAAAVEEERISQLRSEAGAKGREAREQNKEMRQAATAEARELMSAKGSIDEKKDMLVKLAMKYPQVADEVARRLIKEFGLSKYEDVILSVVNEAAARALTAPKKVEQTTEVW